MTWSSLGCASTLTCSGLTMAFRIDVFSIFIVAPRRYISYDLPHHISSHHITLYIQKMLKRTFKYQIKDSPSPLNWPINTKNFLPKTFSTLTQKIHFSNKKNFYNRIKRKFSTQRKKFLYFFTTITNFLSEKNSYTCP